MVWNLEDLIWTEAIKELKLENELRLNNRLEFVEKFNVWLEKKSKALKYKNNLLKQQIKFLEIIITISIILLFFVLVAVTVS